MNTIEAIHTLSQALREDEGYRQSWVANIAMAYMDSEHWFREENNKNGYLSKQDRREIANTAAEYFVQNLEKK